MVSVGQVRTVISTLLSWVIYGASFLMPRNKKVWVFVGWYKNRDRETFADNSKYLYLHTVQNYPEVTAVWLGGEEKICELLRARGYKSHNIHSLRGAFYALRAGYTIIDANMRRPFWRYSGGSKTVQLWHADGIKGLDLSSAWKWSKIRQIFFQPGLFKNIHFFIASSKYIAEKFIRPSFDVPSEKVLITGLPRYDIFFHDVSGSDIDRHEEFGKNIARIKAQGAKKIFFYGPTFRRGKSVEGQLEHLPLKELNQFLSARNYFLVISLHPKFSSSNWVPTETLSHISYANAEFDFYPYLKEFDALITDYSSTCLEFLLLDKPTIFFVYDLDEYRKNPGLPEEFWGLVPGPRVRTFEEVLTTLDAPDAYTEERARVRDILFTFEQGNASENVASAILKEINELKVTTSTT